VTQPDYILQPKWFLRREIRAPALLRSMGGRLPDGHRAVSPHSLFFPRAAHARPRPRTFVAQEWADAASRVGDLPRMDGAGTRVMRTRPWPAA